jgi:peptidoglycan hydrolase-like protein with peptidoglycan-binding domain
MPNRTRSTTSRKPATTRKPATARAAATPAADTPAADKPKRNEVSELAAGKPILTDGAQDARVVELTAALSAAGYDVVITDTVNGALLAAVRKFRADHNVTEDEAIAGGGNVDNYIGPETWAAIARL